MSLKVLLAGSYDPITSGHFSLIEKCASRFDEVHVVAFINAEKKALFSVSQREEMLKIACRPFANVVTGSDSGYVVDYAARHGIALLIRGVRDQTDFAYEKIMADNNRKLNPQILTMFIPADPAWQQVSSHLVKDRIAAGQAYAPLLPPGVGDYIAGVQGLSEKL